MLLDESIAPRVYGFLVMSVFDQDVSVLLMEREDITLRDKFYDKTTRQATPGKVTTPSCIVFANLFFIGSPFCFP